MSVTDNLGVKMSGLASGLGSWEASVSRRKADGAWIRPSMCPGDRISMSSECVLVPKSGR